MPPETDPMAGAIAGAQADVDASAATAQATADAAAAAQAEADADAQPQPAGAQGDPDPKPAADGDNGATGDPPKPEEKTSRRIANLTRKMGEETRAREAAERELAAAKALLEAAKPAVEGDPAKPAPRTAETDVEAAAARLVAERRFNARLGEIDAAGKKELGPEAWEAAKSTMTTFGAIKSQAFLQALAEAESPHKLFAALADDTDQLMELLGKPPAAMAARIGRMDAELSKPLPKPALSAAPKPAAKIEPGAVLPQVDLYNYPPGMSMTEYARIMDKELPPHLGGKRKVA